MLDQTFSAKNFMTIYAQENRMGRIPVETMGANFQTVVANIKTVNKELQFLRNKNKGKKTNEVEKEIKSLKDELKDLRLNKQTALFNEMQGLSAKVNSKDFQFKLEKVQIGRKIGFKIDSKDHAQLFAMKQLQSNLEKTFKVKQANRHLIMTNLKLLLKTKRPFNIIRTDVSSFFESIPQDKLKRIVLDNNLLSYKSKVFVNAILNEYETEKRKLTVDESKGMKDNCGIPRGIGISSLLSEIYMRDIDNRIKKRSEVIFYVRYVDDIFMLIAELPKGQDIITYYNNLIDEFKDKELDLQPKESEKCSLFSCSEFEETPFDITYLGYKCIITNKGKNKQWISSDVSYRLSDDKINRIKHRIDNAFKHFETTNKYNLHQARMDLVDSLKMIAGNVKLHKSKSNVKTGIYYNSDLLDDMGDLENLNNYLYDMRVSLYSKLFHTEDEKKNYLNAIYRRIKKFDFVAAWKSKKMYDLSDRRMRAILRWMNNEEKEDKATL